MGAEADTEGASVEAGTESTTRVVVGAALAWAWA